MKSYVITLAQGEEGKPVVYKDESYRRLSDAHKDLKAILKTIEENPQDFPEDTDLSIMRRTTKKGAPDTENELVRVLCGIDEDDGEFCYEGLYFNSSCSDFEQMILQGEKKGSWIGNYSVRVHGAPVSELCVFSHLDMILQSIQDLRTQPEQICGRVLTITRKNEKDGLADLAMLLYTRNEKTGEMKLQSRIMDEADEKEKEELAAFIHAQEKELSQPQTVEK